MRLASDGGEPHLELSRIILTSSRSPVPVGVILPSAKDGSIRTG
jgi:hypothetical protein